MLLNRKKAPIITQVKHLPLPTPECHVLDNGTPVYTLHKGTQDILKIELIFNAGRPFEQKRQVGRATSSLLKEGNRHQNSAEIAEMVDFYGGTLSTPYSMDTSTVALYSLTKYFDKLLPLLAQLLESPSFPEKELNTFIRNNQRDLQIELAKNEVLGFRKATELIFGEAHPYGWSSTEATYAALTRDDLVQHFQRTYTSNNSMILVSGKLNDNVLQLIQQHLGEVLKKGDSVHANLGMAHPTPEKIKINNPANAGHQTSIHIGRRLFTRKHPDYMGFYILNTVLGGYFGSRLMTNIREEKGYTYHIYSAMEPMLYDGYFYVSTEVGNEFTEKAVAEIYHEFELLKEKPISPSELKMVRNYLLGMLMTSLDGVFSTMDVIRPFLIENTPLTDFDALIDTINTIKAKDLQLLAQKYLNESDMWEVIVSKS